MAAAAATRDSMRRRLTAHMRDRGFFAPKNVAVADVGWGCQIQESISIVAEQFADAPRISGYYMGVSMAALERRGAGLVVEPALSDASQFDWCSSAVTAFVEAYETASRSAHGTVTGYTDDGTPVLADRLSPSRKAEASGDAAIALMQRGLVSYATAYGRCVAMTGLRALDTAPFARTAIGRLMRLPRRCEAQRLLAFSHFNCHWSNTENKALWTGRWYQFVGGAAAVGRSAWKEGQAAVIAGRAAVLAMALARSLRCRSIHEAAGTEAFGLPVAERTPRIASLQPIGHLPLEDMCWTSAEEAGAALERVLPRQRSQGGTLPVTTGELMLLWTIFAVWNNVRRIGGLKPMPTGLVSIRQMVIRNAPCLKQLAIAASRCKCRLITRGMVLRRRGAC